MASLDDHRTLFLRPLLPLTGGLILGIVVGYYWPGGFYPALVSAVTLMFALGTLARRHVPCVLLPLSLCVICGYVAIQPWMRQTLPARHVVHFVDQGQWTVTGKVILPWSGDPRRVRFIIQARELMQKNRRFSVSGRIYISSRGDIPTLEAGDGVVLSGHLHAIRSFANPGGFDYRRYMALKGVRVRLFAESHSIQRIKGTPASMRRPLDRMRRNLGQQMNHALTNFNPAVRAILQALVLGSRKDIGPGLQRAFNRSGVAHVLAISGLHIGMVAATGFAVGFWVGAWIPALVQLGWVRRWAALFALLAVSFYAALSGFSPATQRAVLMAGAFVLSFWVGRRHNWLNILAGAAFIILIAYPPALFSASFQLSFAAVTAIALGANGCKRSGAANPESFWRRLADKAGLLMRMSALAVLGTLPLVLCYFDEWSWLGPLTNLLVIPVVGMITLPAGLLGVLLSPLSTLLSRLCWQIAAWSLTPILAVVKIAGSWSYAAFALIMPNSLETFLFYLLLLLALIWRQIPPRPRIMALCLLLVFSAADTGYWLYQRHGGSNLTVTALDVGQGSANLLELPGGGVVLIDGGGFSDNAVFDAGRSIVAPLLRRRKILTIDRVVLTHPNSDHLNGLIYLLDHFNIGQVWGNQQPAATLGYSRWESAIDANHIPHPTFETMDRHQVINGVCFEWLAPPQDFLQRNAIEPWRDLNANSVVMRVGLKQVAFLFTGDITAATETDLLNRYPPQQLRSTILMVPHHGSRSSSSEAFLNAVGPREGIISAGWHNRFGFPHQQVLTDLNRMDCRIWRTDLCGAIEIKTDGHQYQIKTCRTECAGARGAERP